MRIGEAKMLFLLYWELSPGKGKEFRKLVESLTSEAPIPGIKSYKVYMTADGWGVDIVEADSEKAIFTWALSALNYFKTYKTAPAMTIEEAVKHL